MTSKQRQLAAMRRQVPDRVPIYIRGVSPQDPAWVAAQHPSYAPLVEAVNKYGDVRGSVALGGGFMVSGYDLPTDTMRESAGDWTVVTTTLHTPAGELITRRYESPAGHPGMTFEFVVKAEADLERALSVPYEAPEPPIEKWLAAVGDIGERGLVLIGFANPIAHVHDLLGSSLLAEWTITHRDIIERLTRIFADRLAELVRRWLADPRVVEPVFSSSGQEYAGPPLLSPRDFRAFCTEVEKPISDTIHRRGGLLHVHCHGPMQAIIEQLAELGTDCLHPVEAPPTGDMPLAEAKRRVGRDVCLEGNIQMDDLYRMETRELIAVVEGVMRDGRPGGGFILAPTASPYAPVLTDRARDNYLAMIETGVRMGSYG